MPPRTIRAIVADDHPVVREGTCAVLERDSQITVVAQAANFLEADDALRRYPADALLLDLGKMGGPEVPSVRELARAFPNTAIIVVSAMMSFLPDLFEAGARAYIAKGDPSACLIDAIMATAAGQTYLSPTATSWLDRYSTSPGRGRLSDREDQTIRLIVAGKNSSEMADIMNVDVRTAYNYVHNLKVKTGCRDKTELIDWAKRVYGVDD